MGRTSLRVHTIQVTKEDMAVENMIVDNSSKSLVFKMYKRRFIHRSIIRILWFVIFFLSFLGLYCLINSLLNRTIYGPSHTMFGVEEQLPNPLLTAEQVLSKNQDYSCYAHNEKPYLKFGTRTAYHFVHGGNTRYEPIPHCKPVQIWMLIRHGTKYPEGYLFRRMQTLAELRDKIIENHEARGDGFLCEADLENLRTWRLDPRMNSRPIQDLTEQGVEDMQLLGRRIRSNFPELFPQVLSTARAVDYEFRTAEERRASSSKTAFMSGLLNRVDIPDADVPANDNLFKAYNECPLWRTMVANNPEVLAEVIKFKRGAEYQKLISNIIRRLGFPNITIDSINDMWEMCRQDKSWRVDELSPWCAVFTEEELRVLEYKEDLIDYYKRGYGHEFNIRLGCPLRQNLFQHFQKLESGDYSNQPKGVFNVCYSRSLHPFMAAMGLAKDSKPPLSTGFLSADQRKWRTSEIGSYAANVAAVFYKCNGTGSQNKVKFYLAEKPVAYEGCDAGLCDWEYLKNKFPDAFSDCNFDFCNPPPSAT